VLVVSDLEDVDAVLGAELARDPLAVVAVERAAVRIARDWDQHSEHSDACAQRGVGSGVKRRERVRERVNIVVGHASPSLLLVVAGGPTPPWYSRLALWNNPFHGWSRDRFACRARGCPHPSPPGLHGFCVSYATLIWRFHWHLEGDLRHGVLSFDRDRADYEAGIWHIV
jgi:hypothetical protein